MVNDNMPVPKIIKTAGLIIFGIILLGLALNETPSTHINASVNITYNCTNCTQNINPSYYDNFSNNTDFTTLTNDSMADALHRHSELSASDGSPDAVLTIGAIGLVDITNTYAPNEGQLSIHGATHAYMNLDSATNSDAGILLKENNVVKWDIFNDGGDGDKFKIYDDGNLRLTIQQDGKVGIGTSSPGSLLHINSDAVISNTLLTLESDINNANEYNEILFKIAGGANYGAIRSHLGSVSDSYMTFSTTTDGGSLVQHMTIQHDGKIGFGTKNPGKKVEIYSSSPQLRIRDSGSTAGSSTGFIEFGGTDGGSWNRTGYIGDGSAGNLDLYLQAEHGDLHIGDSSGIVMNLQGGNVGIGTTTPNTKLEVAGTITADKINSSEYLDKSSVLWLQFNNNVDDSSDFGNDGINNGAILDKDVAEFNGSVYVEITDDSSINFTNTTSFSVELWFKTSNATGYLFSKRQTSGSFLGYMILFSSGRPLLRIDSTTGSKDTFAAVRDYTNKWIQVTVVYDALKTQKMYINGILDETDNASTTGDFSNNANLHFARYSSGYFNHTIDEVRIYNRALSPAEIQREYARTSKNIIHANKVITNTLELDDGINISYDGDYLRFDYGTSGTDIARFSGNMSALDYYSRTSVYDKSRGKALDYIQDSVYYSVDDKIDHSKFYGYVSYEMTDKSRPEIEFFECCLDDDYFGEGICKEKATCNRTIYPYKKTVQEVSLNKEIDVLRQSIYELKTELCNYNVYNWC